jgi:hypothetical protein
VQHIDGIAVIAKVCPPPTTEHGVWFFWEGGALMHIHAGEHFMGHSPDLSQSLRGRQTHFRACLAQGHGARVQKIAVVARGQEG